MVVVKSSIDLKKDIFQTIVNFITSQFIQRFVDLSGTILTILNSRITITIAKDSITDIRNIKIRTVLPYVVTLFLLKHVSTFYGKT